MYWQIETLQSQINFNMQLGGGKESKDDIILKISDQF